jgi:hypothetical protein
MLVRIPYTHYILMPDICAHKLLLQLDSLIKSSYNTYKYYAKTRKIYFYKNLNTNRSLGRKEIILILT